MAFWEQDTSGRRWPDCWRKPGTTSLSASNSRGPHTLRDLAERLGHGVTAYSNEDAARFGELVIETVPFGHYNGLPTAQLTGKIVVDTANYYPERDGQIDLGGLSESAFMALHLGSARVVKAFNAIPAADLEGQGNVDKPLDERRAIPIASDDAEAKAVVSRLIEDIGFVAVDNGDLKQSKTQQPGTPIYGKKATVQQAREVLEI